MKSFGLVPICFRAGKPPRETMDRKIPLFQIGLAHWVPLARTKTGHHGQAPATSRRIRGCSASWLYSRSGTALKQATVEGRPLSQDLFTSARLHNPASGLA